MSFAKSKPRPASASIRRPNKTASSHSADPQFAYTNAPQIHYHDEKCICQICSCGGHRCPPTPVHGRYESDLASAYKNDYKGAWAPATRVVHRDAPMGSSLPFDHDTTTRADYKWHVPAPRTKPAQSVHDRSFLDRSMPFDGETTNKTDFKAWKVAPGRPAPRDMSFLSGPDDRDFRSEFRAQYDEKQAAQARSFKPVPGRSAPVAFEGMSTHQQDYQKWAVAPAKPYGNRDMVFTGPEDRDFRTEHRGEFDRKRVDPCEAIPLQVNYKTRTGHIYHQRDHVGRWRRRETPVPTTRQAWN